MSQPEDRSALRHPDGGLGNEPLQKCSSRSPMAEAIPTVPRTRKVQEGVPATARGKSRRLEASEDKRDQQMVHADADTRKVQECVPALARGKSRRLEAAEDKMDHERQRTDGEDSLGQIW